MIDFDLDFFNQIVSDVPGHIYIKNLKGEIIACNQKQAETLGFDSPEKLFGQTDYDLTSAQMAKKIQEADAEVIQKNCTCTFEEEFRVPSGEVIYYLSHKKPFRDASGKVIGILGNSFEVTTQKIKMMELEKQLAIAEEKARVSQLMAASIAHEMRTPVARFGMQIERMRMSLAQGDSPLTIADEMEKILKEANTIIEMLLMKSKFSKISVSQSEQIAIQDVVRSAMLEFPFREGQLELVEVSDKADFNFKGQKLYFVHVFFNLLKNALVAIQKADKGKILILIDSANKTVIFKDTGSGIDPQIMPHIFEEFYTQSERGTGVGLALCQKIMRDISGDMTCDSQLGEHTTFTLQFPKLEGEK